MGQVLTNNTGLIHARETSLGVLPGSPDWKADEPNAQGEFGSQVTTVPRSPVSPTRQRRKGRITDLDASSEFDADLTLDAFVDYIEAFLFSTAVNADMTFIGANALGTGFTIPTATAAQAAKFQFTAGGPISLIHTAGYLLAANNSGIQTVTPITADVTPSDVLIPVTSAAIETAPTNAEVSIAGIRAEVGDIDCAVAAGVATITSGNNAAVNNVNFTTLGLTVGQRLHVGGTAAANRFGSAAGGSNDSFGSGRILTLAAATMTLDKIDATLTASDGTATGAAGANDVPCDLLFGRFIRNVPVTDSEFAQISYHFEQSYPNLFETDPPTPVGSPDGFGYVLGALASVLTMNMPLTDKATMVFAFIGTTSEEPVDNASRKSGASTARQPLFTGAFNTSSDFFRLRIEDVDETGLTSDFKDLVVTMNNNVTPEKVLGLLGARFMNTGNFEFDIEASALFTNSLVPARIRANTTVSMDWLIRNDDGAIAFDVPSATLGSDGKEFPVNESVLINLKVEAFVDPTFDTSIGVSLFPVFPIA